MAILWMDGFEDGNTANVSGGSYVTGRGSGSSMALGLASAFSTTVRIPKAATDTLCASFAVKIAGGQSGRPIIAFLGDSTAVSHVYLTVDGAGLLSAYNSNGALLGSASPGFVPNIWWHLEAKVKMADSGGVCQVWFNGVQVINATGDTKNGGTNTYLDSIRFGGPAGTDFVVDDLVVYDETTSANNIAPLGDSVVEHLRPVAPDIQADWVGSDGNSLDNWALLDEIGGLTSTDYVWSTTVDATDLYTLADPVRTSGTVLGVMTLLDGERTDTGTRSVAALLREGGGTIRESAPAFLPFGSVDIVTMVCDRLAAGGAWTIPEVKNLGAGVKLKG